MLAVKLWYYYSAKIATNKRLVSSMQIVVCLPFSYYLLHVFCVINCFLKTKHNTCIHIWMVKWQWDQLNKFLLWFQFYNMLEKTLQHNRSIQFGPPVQVNFGCFYFLWYTDVLSIKWNPFSAKNLTLIS